MANNTTHSHPVVDTDSKHFVIDPITRTIKNETSKLTLIRNDINSERFTFEIPKEIEGHDMTECDLVEIHFINVNTNNRTVGPSKGVYIALDFAQSATDPTKCTFSWLLSGAATKYVGALYFSVRLKCTAQNEDGETECVYSWNTAIYQGINIADSIDNSEDALPLEDYSDLIASFQQEIHDMFEKELESFTEDYNNVSEEVLSKEPIGVSATESSKTTVTEEKTITEVTVTKTDGSTTTFNVEAQNGKDAEGLIGLEVVDGHLILETSGTKPMNFAINQQGELEIIF